MIGKTTKTPGELLFEEYLSEQGVPFDFEERYPKRRKKPDYTIISDGQEFLFDVKDFARTDFPEHGGYYDPIGPIRLKIDAAEDKFQEYKAYSCGLVLYNQGAPLIHLSDPLILFGSMFGNPGFAVPISTSTGAPSGPTTAEFLDGGKMIHSRGRKPRMEHISALLTIRRVNVGHLRLDRYVNSLPKNAQQSPKQRAIALLEHLDTVDLPFDRNEQAIGVIVWENILAEHQLSPHLFRGEYDERWTVGKSGPMLSYRGSQLQELKGESSKARSSAS